MFPRQLKIILVFAVHVLLVKNISGEVKIILEYDFKNLVKEKSGFLRNVEADLNYNIAYYENQECTTCQCLPGAMNDSNAMYAICVKVDTSNGQKKILINVLDTIQTVLFAQSMDIENYEDFDIGTRNWMIEINKLINPDYEVPKDYHSRTNYLSGIGFGPWFPIANSYEDRRHTSQRVKFVLANLINIRRKYLTEVNFELLYPNGFDFLFLFSYYTKKELAAYFGGMGTGYSFFWGDRTGEMYDVEGGSGFSAKVQGGVMFMPSSSFHAALKSGFKYIFTETNEMEISFELLVYHNMISKVLLIMGSGNNYSYTNFH